MTIDYEYIDKQLNLEASKIIKNIISNFSNCLTPEIKKNLPQNLDKFIIVEKPTKEDVERFSKEAGVKDPSKYGIEHVPSAHGGRAKSDGLIHIYPYSQSFEKCKNNDEIINLCLNDIITHEIFHYFIRPDNSIQNDPIKDEFSHYITEGLVQLYAEEYQLSQGKNKPYSNYDKNVQTAKQLIEGLPDAIKKDFTKLHQFIFSCSLDSLLANSKNGKDIFERYSFELNTHAKINNLVKETLFQSGITDKNEIEGIIKHFRKLDINQAIEELANQLTKMQNVELQTRLNEIKNDVLVFEKKNQNTLINYFDLNNKPKNEEEFREYCEKNGYINEEQIAKEKQKLAQLYPNYGDDKSFYKDVVENYAKEISPLLLKEYSNLPAEVKEKIETLPKRIKIISEDEAKSVSTSGKKTFAVCEKRSEIIFCPDTRDYKNPIDKALAIKASLIHEVHHIITESIDKSENVQYIIHHNDNTNQLITLNNAGYFFDEGLVEKSALDFAKKYQLLAMPVYNYIPNVQLVDKTMQELGVKNNENLFNINYNDILSNPRLEKDTLKQYKSFERETFVKEKLQPGISEHVKIAKDLNKQNYKFINQKKNLLNMKKNLLIQKQQLNRQNEQGITYKRTMNGFINVLLPIIVVSAVITCGIMLSISLIK